MWKLLHINCLFKSLSNPLTFSVLVELTVNTWWCACRLYVHCCSCLLRVKFWTSYRWYLLRRASCVYACARLCVCMPLTLPWLCILTQKRKNAHGMQINFEMCVAWRWCKSLYLCLSLQHGEQWQKNACTTCICDRGQSKCHTHTCRPVTCDKVGSLTHAHIHWHSVLFRFDLIHFILWWNSNGCRNYARPSIQ